MNFRNFYFVCFYLRIPTSLSHYLFVLCIEVLSQQIKTEVEVEEWQGIKLSRGDPTPSHLCFADNILLLGEASDQQTDIKERVLRNFFMCSRQIVNILNWCY